MTDAPELLPCPFCGGDAYFERLGDRRQSTIVACENCGCRLENGEEWGHGSAWNARADLHQQALAEAEARGYARAVGDAAKIAAEMDGEWFQNTYKASYEKKRYSADQVERMARKPLHILSEDIAAAIRALAQKEGE